MGLPRDNEEGYRLGDPATYVDQLKGNLLLIHGTGDDNVHFEGEGTTLHLYNLITRYLHENLPAGGRDATS